MVEHLPLCTDGPLVSFSSSKGLKPTIIQKGRASQPALSGWLVAILVTPIKAQRTLNLFDMFQMS